MRTLPIVALLSLCACEPPEARLAPVPNPEQTLTALDFQSRVLPVDRDQVFPKVLEVAMSLGYHIRFASDELGQLSLYQEWEDSTLAGRPRSLLELTLRVSREGNGLTRMRLLGTGRGQGMGSSRQEAVPLGPAQYKDLLDQFQRQLCTASRP